jgi:hypothetical protein
MSTAISTIANVSTGVGASTVTGPVPRWARRAAVTVALLNVPSGLWRLALAVGIPVGLARHEVEAIGAPGWGSLYLVILTLAAEGLAYLTLGLVRPWGETWPRWIPRLGGRTVPVMAAVAPAGIGALLTTVYGVGLVYSMFNAEMDGSGWGLLLINVTYAPLVLWGPLLGAVTVHYYRRRTRPATEA